MPRFFDLLNDDTKKEIAAEAKKRSVKRGGDHPVSPASAPKKRNDGKRPFRPSATFSTIPDFVALDVETTGLDFKLDRVIEIGAVKFVGGKIGEEFSTFLNPGVPIPDHITRLTQINTDDIKDAPSFADAAPRLLEFIGDLPICGHQTEFDLTFINAELKRAARGEIAPQIIDTVLLARVLLQDAGRFSLTHVCEALGIPLVNAHRALDDARASGEAALRLIPKFNDQPLEVRQALAAFAPGSMFKTFAIKSLRGERYGVNMTCQAAFASRAPKLEVPSDFTAVEISTINNIFSSGGKAEKIIKGFSSRPAQKRMAVSVTHALNASGVSVAEAGTGTGKSLAYLVPAAYHAIENNCRVIVSTHTRNLQDQLINNDLPAASALCDKELRFTKLKGRNNYLCRARFYKMIRGEIGNLSARERFAALPLIPWSYATRSGDIEEQTFFNSKWFFKIWNLIAADSLGCAGRRCEYYGACFLNRARQLAQTSHVVVINHALFYSDICSETSFLGDVGSIIFDEAHHLEASGHRHLRTEFDNNRVTGFVDRLQNLLQILPAYAGLIDIGEFEKSLKGRVKDIRKHAQDLMDDLGAWAARTDPSSRVEYQIPINEKSMVDMRKAAVVDVIFGELADAFYRFRQILADARDKYSGIEEEQVKRRERIEELREDAQKCSEQTSQMRADLQYLISAKTDDHVFWLEGNHTKKWAKLCGVPLDISGLLSKIWERCSGGIVFTSATLAAEGNADYFKRAVGLLPFEERTETLTLKSPYSRNQTLFCAFSKSPDPDDPAYPAFAAQVIAGVHAKLGKNILVLFTSNAMLNNVFEKLKSRPDIDRNCLLAQNYGGSRSAMLDQFKEKSGMILLGTDSFWEGVDAPGSACEAVIIPRLPFPVPTHPLTMALAKRMEALYGNSFFNYSVPEAVIKFRQGAGRLIRSHSDKGALIVLDNRIITKGYGKQFVNAVDSPVKDFGGDVDGLTGRMIAFFGQGDGSNNNSDNNDCGGDPNVNITYVPFEEL